MSTVISDPDLRATPKASLPRRLLTMTATWVFLLDIVLVVVFGVLSQHQVFWSVASIQALMLNGTQALLLALGLAVLLGGGVFDLSLGANLVLSSVVGGLVMQSITGTFSPTGDYPNVLPGILAGLAAALLTGVLYGLVNGLIISLLDINALIATLGTMGIGLGIALVLTGGGNVSGLPTQLQSTIGLNMVGGIVPLPALVALALAVLIALMLRFTRFGMRSLAMGSSRSAVTRAGIDTRLQIIRLTIISGGLAGLAGFLDLARFGATSTGGHAQDALNAVTAVVIGGTLLEGGKVSIIGAIWGTVLAVVLQSGLIVIGVAPFYQLIAVGAVLIVAMAIDRFRFTRQRS
jgi:ribose transport system permease protein